jgi:hypothetical protein
LQSCDWHAIGRRAEANCAHARKRLADLPPDVSLDAFIDAAADVGPLDDYKHFNDVARDMLARVRADHGTAAARAFLRAVLGRAIRIHVDGGRYQQLPPLCAQCHAAQLARIANDTDLDAPWLDLESDLFHKEFGIASLRLYVAGSNLVDYRCGISRSTVLRGGLSKALGNLRAMLRLGGFKPYFQGHLHAFNLAALSEPGREDFYRCCVELYALHPDILGMFCSSWYYDPALDGISPWLAYLRATPVAGGAHLMRVAADEEAIANATSKSRTRKRLYEAGSYVPTTYMFVWGKNDMIAWAEAHPRTDT